jgi:hypothetical protein
MEQWTVDPMSRQRTAMQIAAFLLDEAGERSLAEFLLCARPEHAMTVAAARCDLPVLRESPRRRVGRKIRKARRTSDFSNVP